MGSEHGDWTMITRRVRLDRSADGSALIPALMMVSMLAMLGLSMLSSGMSGARIVNGQSDDFRLTSAVESVGTLSAERLWSGYLRQQGGAASTINTFRNYLTVAGIADSGPGGPPTAAEGIDLRTATGIPGSPSNPEFDDVNVDALRVLRRDEGESTRLYITVAATTNRGKGIATRPANRAIQLVYTVEPAPFEGFDYGILTKNVNCIFCHTVVDSADRVYNHDPSLFGTFAKVKVGTLESLMLRNDGRPGTSDWDADSVIAGTLYVRGTATNQNGVPIGTNAWGSTSAHSCTFNNQGELIQDQWGNVTTTAFQPAGNQPLPGENLYLNYPTTYSDMPDGKLPTSFPPPFPDDGGIDPATGLPTPAGAGNKKVDPNEFHAAALHADGSITGVVNFSAPGVVISDPNAYIAALTSGNQSSFGPFTADNPVPPGNVIVTGTEANPIVFNGSVAIDGDVVISGWVKGSGTIIASGNVYVPTDLHYLDGHTYLPGDSPGSPTGPVTFGIAQDGTKNALGLACGGNMLIGDYLKPQAASNPGQYDIVTGNPDSGWNFTLAEISLFNRTEWEHTQPKLPGPGENHNDPSTWSVSNPNYEAGYIPRYYQFGAGDDIPIYNLGNLYFDAGTATWIGDADVPTAWDTSKMTLLDPNDTSNPLLYDQQTGLPTAAVLQATPKNDWLDDAAQKFGIEYFESQRPENTPMQIDGLLYTNNAIFGIVERSGPMKGQLVINGSLVCPDLGVLAPGHRQHGGSDNVPGSPYAAGLRLNYDKRTKGMLNVANPNQVTIKLTLWNPTANVL